MITEHTFDTNGHLLNLAVGPEHGPPLLLLHGISRAWTDFAPLLPALTTRWHVHAIDFRGHGKSARRPREYRAIDFAHDAIAVIQTFRQPVVVVGHSLGALAAAAAAATAPDRVRGIILEDPPAATLVNSIRQTPFFALFSGLQVLAGDAASVSELARQLAVIPLPGPGGTTIRLGDTRDAASLRFIAKCLKSVDPTVFDPLLSGRFLDGFPLETIMRKVKCPALIMRGDESKGGMLGRDEAVQWTKWMADGVAIDIPGVGHLLHWLATETTIRLCLSFLESLER